MNQSADDRPLVRSFQSSVAFLSAYYEFRKRDAGFSYEAWAKELNFRNRSYLRFVVTGRRPVSEALMKLFIPHFGFSPEDAEYFVLLVHYTQSKSPEQRRVFGKRLTALLALGMERTTIERHYEFLSDALLPILQTVCGFKDAPVESGDIAALFDRPEKEISDKLAILEEMGLTHGNRSLTSSWKIPPAFRALGHREFYRQSLHRAEAAIEMPFELRRFRSLFVAMGPAEFDDFLKDFEVFVAEQLAKRGAAELKDRRLYHLNFNFFPETRIP